MFGGHPATLSKYFPEVVRPHSYRRASYVVPGAAMLFLLTASLRAYAASP
jgi:hypothetical protein